MKGRLGLLGGTFDPIHFGHIDAAEAARTALALDEVLLIPAHDPPHRPVDPRATSFHRFALVALAIDGRPGYRVSDAELRREGPSYTIDTLHSLHAHGWRPWQLFFILGADAFAEIATWREYPAILDAAHFAVIARPGLALEAVLMHVPAGRGRVRTPAEAVSGDTSTGIFGVDARTRGVSSTAVRARLLAGQPIEGLVPEPVARHIRAHQLYGAVDELHGEDQGQQSPTRGRS